MPIFVIWLDQSHAKLFQFSNEKMERSELNAHHVDHHTHKPDSIDHQHQEKVFFGEIASKLETAGQLLILGPGLSKLHFQSFLKDQKPMIWKKVVGCETVDHPTDGQIAELARKFFRLEPSDRSADIANLKSV